MSAVRGELPGRLAGAGPKGQQLREVLEALIAGLGAGALLPSERTLAERYGLARMTVRKELDRLVAEGAAYRVHGRGTFVAESRIVQSQSLTSFTEDITARGMVPGGRVLVHELIEADEALAAALERPPGAPVVHLRRVRTADAEPIALEWVYLPAEDFPGLERVRLENRSLLALLRERYGVTPGLAHQRVSAVVVGPEDAAVLGARPGDPAFQFRRITRRPSGRVIEYARSLYLGDRYDIEMTRRST